MVAQCQGPGTAAAELRVRHGLLPRSQFVWPGAGRLREDQRVQMAMVKILIFGELRDHGVRLSRRQIHRLESLGLFPKRVQISERRVGWLAKEIDAHVAKQIEARE